MIAETPKEITLALHCHGILSVNVIYPAGDFLFQLYYEQNSSDKGVEVNGKKYICNTYSQIQTNYQLPYSVDSIKSRIVLPLEKAGILISCKPNKFRFHQRKAYRVNEEALQNLISQWLISQWKES